MGWSIVHRNPRRVGLVITLLFLDLLLFSNRWDATFDTHGLNELDGSDIQYHRSMLDG